MTKLLARPIFYIILLAFIILGVWISYLPSRIVANIKMVVQEETGRALTYRSINYSFTPEFGFTLNDVSLAGTAVQTDPAVHANKLFVPLSIVQLIMGNASADTLSLDGATVHVAFDGVGHSNIFAGESPKSWPALKVQFTNSSFHYFDERSGDQFTVEQISGDANCSSDGEINSSGSAVVNGQFVNFTTTLASLERAFSDGSPLDLTVEGVASSFSFSGRIATDKRLNLAGLADMSSTDVPRMAKWLGADISALTSIKTMSITGALDSDGPVMLLKDAQLKIGNVAAKGDVSFSNSGVRPNMTAALGVDNLDFTSLYDSAANADGWSDKAIDFSGLNAFDMQFRIAANSLQFKSLKSGPATVEGALQNRVLSSSIKSQDFAGGIAQIELGLDATQIPPTFKLDVSAGAIAAKPALNILFGHTYLDGALGLEAHLSAIGKSAAEIVSTLSGDATTSVDQGTLIGADVATLAAKPSNGWNGGLTSGIKVQAQVKLSDGVATLAENQLDGTGFSLHSEGEIDLLRRSLDVTTGPDIKVKIQGPWAMPNLTPQ